jgi:hypothetical protein
MTPDGAVRLLDVYARAQAALERDELDQATALLEEASTLIAEPDLSEADPATMQALAGQAEAARRDAEAAMTAARDRLLRAAAVELRTGGEGSRAYAGSDERPPARFIDRTG